MKEFAFGSDCYGQAATMHHLPDAGCGRRWVRWMLTALMAGGLSLTAKALVYQGITNTSLGSASVAVECCISNLGSGGQDGLALIITNLGSSGQDGVSLALPTGLTGMSVQYEPLDVSNTLPVGAYVQAQAVGTADGISDGVLGTATVTKTGTSNYVFSADYSALGVSTYTVQAYLQGVLVAQATHQNGSSLATANVLPNGKDLGDRTLPLSDEWPGQSVALTIGTTTRVQCDHLIITPEDLASVIEPTAFQIVASQVPVITIYSENASLVYQGLTNTSLGSASVAIVCCVSNLGSGGQDGLALIITNLGSSGQDGLTIALPANLTGLDVQYEPLDVSNTLPAGAYVQEQLVGTGNGVTNDVLGSVTATKQGGTGATSYGLSANFSPLGATTYTVQAYLNGVMVAQATGQSNQPETAASLPDSCGFGTPPANAQKVTTFLWGAAYFDWTVATSITFSGGTNVTCDHLYITPENVASGGTPAAFQVTASQVPALTIISENVSLGYQGLINTTLGGAAASIACCVSNLGSSGQDGLALVITNLGSSGQDGLAITLPAGVTGVDVGIDPLDVSNSLPVDAYVQEQVVGMAPGITNGVLGTVTVTKAGTTNYVMSANFSPLGASSYTVQAYRQGVLVAQTTNQNGGALASCFIWPLTFDKEVSDEGGTVWTIDWNLATAVALTGGANVTCDRLFITPNNAPANTATAFEITASQVPSLTIYSENASLVYQGLTNTSLGNASVAIACCISNLGSSGQDGLALVITNLGSSGQDGVSITMPANLTGLDVAWGGLDPSNTLPVGAYLQEQAVGTANGITNGVLGTATVTKQGISNFLVSADFSALGADTYTVQAYLQGILVAQATGQPGGGLATASFWPDTSDNYFHSIFDWQVSWDWSTRTSVAVAGSASVVCDRLEITAENVSVPIAPAAFQIVASQVPGFTIYSENASLVYQGLTNTSLGNASVAIACCISNLGSSGQDGLALVITNLGSSGQDGLSIALPAGVTGVDVGIDPLDVSNSLPVDAYVQEQVVGMAPGITNGVLGTVTVTKAGTTNYVMSANFSPLGASSYTVQAYLRGVLVAQTTNQNGGALASCFIWPLTFDKEVSDEGGTVWTIDWNLATAVALTGGANVTCDRLFITPNNAPANSSTAFQITASQVPSLTIYSENASLVYQGLTNTSLGNASMAVDCCISNLGSGGQDGLALIITNLGSSGQDGLTIALPGGESALNVSWLSLDAANTLPVGAYVEEQAVGTANGITNGSLGAVTVTKNGTSNYVMSADFSPMGATTYTVQAYFQGVLVAQATDQDGETLAQAANLNFSFDIGWTCCPWTFHMSVDWGAGGTSAFVGTTRVTCDHLDITPDNVSLGSAPTAFQITASQVPALTIIGENASLSYQGLVNTSLGSATVVDNPQDGVVDNPEDGLALIITNLGSSGQDGVGIAMPAGLTGLDVGIDPLDVSNTLPVGAYVQGQVVGTANGITNGVLGTVTVTKEGGTGTTSYEVSANYSAIGASNYTVQAYLQGVLVAQATNQPGASLADPPRWPDTWGFIPGGFIYLDWFTAISISVAGSNVTCDHLYIRPVGTGTVSLSGTPSAFQIVASQVPAFTIISENVSLVYQGLTNTSLGSAAVSIACCVSNLGSGGQDGLELVITNLGSSGQDGLSMALPAGVTGLDVGWEDLDPSNTLPAGAYIQGQAVGTANGITNGILGTVTVTKECAICGGSNYLATADFSPAGVTSYTMLAYLNGVQVAQVMNSPSASLPFFPNTFGITNWSFYLDYSSATSLSIAGASVTCDHLYMRPILPKGATLPAAPSAFQIVASQVPEITLTTVAVSPWLVSMSLNDQTATLQWYGTGVLQGSTNLTTWTDITNATSPYAVGVSSTQPAKFYRLVFRP